MRAFIAIELPGPVQKQLSLLQAGIPLELGSVAPAKSFHLTLKFLGDISEEKAARVRELLASVRHEPFEAAISGTGFFPDGSRIRVVWAGAGPVSQFVALQQKIEAVLHGLFPRDNEFVPHITLARVRFLRDRQKFTEQVKEIRTGNLAFSVGSFSLKKSTLSRDGPVYEDIAVFPLVS